MDKALDSTLDKVIRLCSQRPDFASELQRRLSVPSPEISPTVDPSLDKRLMELLDGIYKIGGILEIQQGVQPSVSYDFVKDQSTRDQLIIDNIRMENTVHSTRIPEVDRLPLFCLSAFYQIEGLLNYFFTKCYPNLDDFTKILIRYTAQEKKNFQFTQESAAYVRSVGGVGSHYKINAFCWLKAPGDKGFKFRMGMLRTVRNAMVHRCLLMQSDTQSSGDEQESETDYKAKFLKENTFSSIREDLRRLVSLVHSHIAEREPRYVRATISNILPSACFIKYDDGSSTELPSNMRHRVSGCSLGDRLRVTLMGSQIIDVSVEG